MGEERIEQILAAIHDIKKSGLSVKKYFDARPMPFSRVQYYNYLRILKEHGEEGLRDKRKEGNNRKLNTRIKDYVRVVVKEDPALSATEMQV